jgi:hypothetical protein
MIVSHQDQSLLVTDHALLIAYAHFAEQIGLISAVEHVPFPMKTIIHSPADKVIELLCHVLAGGMHINELAKSAHPLVHDQAVAHAWGQASFASASGVSELLQSTSDDAVEALKSALGQVIEPYRRRLLRALSPSWLVVDFDLTGLVVSDQATTYEGADFGHLGEGTGDGGVARGYQFARAQLVGDTDAFVLEGFLHPGRTVAGHCLEELVALTERHLGRPRRRVDCVQARLAETERELVQTEAELAGLTESGKAPRRRERLAEQREHNQQEIEGLRARLVQMEAENAANPTPRRIILRLDGAFGSAGNVARLYEQGYSVVARVQAHRVAMALRKEDGLIWDKVSKNLLIAEAQRTMLGDCPYAVRLFLCRQWWGEKHPDRFSALVVTPDLTLQAWPVRRVGVFYNDRQVIEAGIKESKGVFASRHLPTRHQAGIALYQELVLFAQNLTRWFRRQCLGRSILAAASIKELVRIGANCRAQISLDKHALELTFAVDSPWGGITLSLKPQISYQLWFPFLEDYSLFARAGP